MQIRENAGPIAVVGAIVLLVGLLFFLYRANFAPTSSNISPENAPDYAKKSGMVQTGGTPTTPQNANPATAPAPYGGPAPGGR